MPASPVRPEGQGDQVLRAESSEGVVRLPNGVHTNNAVASSSKVEAVNAEPVSAVALGKRKWRESEIVAESSREIDLSLQLDYLATQYPEQRIPPPNLHPPGFTHYDVPIGDSLDTARQTRSPSKTRIKLEDGEAVQVQPSKEEVKSEPVAEGPPPFRDAEDVVERLLPWHVWQIWDEDLDYQPLSEAACKAAEAVPQEQGKRLVDVIKRFTAVREREAKHASNVPSLLQLHPNLAQMLRAEIAPLQHQLRAARHELDTFNRTKREQEERQRRIKEETERRERDARRVEELKKGQATSSQAASRPNSGPSTPGAAAGTTADGKPQPPVVVNLSMSHLPQAIKIGLLALPGTAPVGVKPPATVVRTVDEQKVTVTIDLARCSQAHIAFLAKCLNIQPIAPGAAASSSSTSAKSPANNSPAKPSPK